MFRQGIQNVFQPTRAGWIIVDALLIQHQRIRPIKIRTQPNRTDEAVLHAYQPDAHSLAGTLKSYCAFGRPYHDIAAVCLRPFDGFPPIRKKTDGSRGRLQKGPGMRTFPSGKANTCVEPLIPFILKTLGRPESEWLHGCHNAWRPRDSHNAHTTYTPRQRSLPPYGVLPSAGK